MKYLLIINLILLPACGDQHYESTPVVKQTRSTEKQFLEDKYLQLLSSVNNLNNIILSDFATCEDSGDSSDALINKICKVAQAATVEAKVEMKAEISNTLISLEETVNYTATDLNQLLENSEDYDDRINAIETNLSAIETTIATLETRVSSLEDQLTDITEGVCYRTRSALSTGLNGSQVTFAWDTAIRMNSSYCTYNIPTAEYTIQKSGWYQITYKANFLHTNGSSRQSLRSWILLNNITQLDLSRTHLYLRQSTQGEYGTMTTSFLVELNTNDTIELQNDGASGNGGFGSGSASYDLLGTESFFVVKYIDDN